jgi:putative transposase
VVEPSVKRQVIGYLKESYEAGVETCVGVLNMSRSSWYYQSKKDDTELISELKRLAIKYPTRGFDNYYHRLKRSGFKWSRNKVLRVYRELEMVRRPKKRRKLPESLRKPLEEQSEVNQVWSMDFMSDSLSDGRTLRVLNVMDDYNRESLLNIGSISFPSSRVLRELDELIESYGKPKFIRTDNGPEFRSNEYNDWMVSKGIKAVYTEPGKPMQNGYIERLNRTFREDVLDAYQFESITQFNIIVEKWQSDYNENHPHQSLQNKSPKEYAQRSHPYWGLAPNKGELNTIF